MTVLAVDARGLSRRFVSRDGREVSALTGVDLAIDRGAFVVVSGPSGCGKTTLLNILGLLDHPSIGAIALEGVAVGALGADAQAQFRREHIGYLFQDGGLIERMTAGDNVALPLVYAGAHPDMRRMAVRAVLARVGLLDREASLVSELSGGERQRIGLARALVGAPALTICDEPTAALDEANSIAMCDILHAITRDGGTVICSSHDPIVMGYASQRVELERGRLVSSGRP